MMTVHVIIWNLHNGCFTLICSDGVAGAPAQSGLEQHDGDGAELTQPENVNIGDGYLLRQQVFVRFTFVLMCA